MESKLNVFLKSHLIEFINAGSLPKDIFLTFLYEIFLLGISTIFAYISWHLYEKQFLVLKDRFAPRADMRP